MKIWVYTISWNEAVMMPWFLRHYSSFADRIIVWDENSNDGTRELVQACPIATLRDWPGKGMDDNLFIEAYDTWTMESCGKADWVMTPDVDELLWHENPRKALAETSYQVIGAEGQALIGDGPVPSGPGQLYEHIRKIHRQENYDKWIIRSGNTSVAHHIGRHGKPQSASGTVEPEPSFKLFHCHYFNPAYTLARNRRNYDRNTDKKYAWNYTAEWEDKKWVGTHTWHQEILDKGKAKPIV